MEPHSHHTSHRSLAIASAITLAFAFVELGGGLWSGSLALISDAGHMFLDSLSLFLALIAVWISRLPSTPKHSYGWVRAEVIAALTNGLVMLVIVAFIVYEGVGRLRHPVEVRSLWVVGLRGRV